MQSCCQWLLNILRVFSSQACCCNHEKQIKKGSESFHLFSAPNKGLPPIDGHPKTALSHLESNEIQISVADLFLHAAKKHISPIQGIPYFLLLAHVCPNFHWFPDLILDSAIFILGFSMFQHVSSLES